MEAAVRYWWVLLAMAGCSEVDGRNAQLVQFLSQDNAVWLRDHARLESKFDRMERDPYDFMRGTAGLMYADLGRQSEARTPTAFVQSAAAGNLIIIGDPHPENLGTTRWADGTLSWEFIDLDGVHYGPWQTDLRRAAQGLSILLYPLEEAINPCQADCRDLAVEALVQGYIVGLNDADTTWNPGYTNAGGIFFQARWEEAREEGEEQKRIQKAVQNSDPEQFTVDQAVDSEGSGRLAIPASEQALVEQLLDSVSLPEDARTLDVIAIYGRGVSSHAARRYEVLWDLGERGHGDDNILEIREAVDTGTTPRPPAGSTIRWNGLADRLKLTADLLWSSPLADPYYQAYQVGNVSVRARSRNSYFQGLKHDKFAEEWEDEAGGLPDLLIFSQTFGRALALVHRRGQTGNGTPTTQVILDDIDGRTQLLVEELQDYARADLARLLDDHQRFIALRQQRGPLLGIDSYEPENRL